MFTQRKISGAADARGSRQVLPTLRAGARAQKVVGGLETVGAELLRISGTDALDLRQVIWSSRGLLLADGRRDRRDDGPRFRRGRGDRGHHSRRLFGDVRGGDRDRTAAATAADAGGTVAATGGATGVDSGVVGGAVAVTGNSSDPYGLSPFQAMKATRMMTYSTSMMIDQMG